MLIGDPSKAKELLDWEPKVKFEELIRVMVESDWDKVQKRGF
jgi:GDPmannose 4,6-dehydratase